MLNMQQARANRPTANAANKTRKSRGKPSPKHPPFFFEVKSQNAFCNLEIKINVERLQVSHPQRIRGSQFLWVHSNADKIDHGLIGREVCAAGLASDAAGALDDQV